MRWVVRLDSKLRVAVLALALMFPVAQHATAQQSSVSFGPVESFTGGGSLEVKLTIDPNITSGARLTLTDIFGDLNAAAETVKISADGVDIGSFGGFGGEDCTARPDQTIDIAQATLAPLIKDGSLTLSFTASAAVDACSPSQPNLRISGTLSTGAAPEAEAGSAVATNRNFMRRRADSIVSVGPDLSQIHARLSASSDDASSPTAQVSNAGLTGLALNNRSNRLGDGIAGLRQASSPADHVNAALNHARKLQAFNLLGGESDGVGRYSFFTSLSQVQRATLAQRADKLGAAVSALGVEQPGNASKFAATQLPFDVWVQGEFLHFRDDIGGGDSKGHTGLVFVGADFVLTSSVIAGALVQFDFAEDKSSVLGTRASGNGWMAGPYLSARIARDVFLDLRASWGRSDNESNPGGATTDNFDTRRRLLSASLTGNWHAGATRLTPSLSLKHFRETQESYVDGSGVFVPAQTITLGRLAFGAELGHTFHGPNKVVIEPHVSVQGIWDFEADETVTVAGLVVNAQQMRGKIGGGVRVTAPSGVSLRTSAAYDGLGDKDFDAYQGKVFVIVPFN